MQDTEFMELALEQARFAAQHGDVPVGAVIVKDGVVIAAAGNRREQDKDATAHAELLAIRQACQVMGGWRLSGCTLYVTLEPCPMCTGAIINARLDRVVYGLADEKAGCCGSVACIPDMPLNHRPIITRSILSEACGMVLKEFFGQKRQERTK